MMVEKAKGNTKSDNNHGTISMDLSMMVKNLVETHTQQQI